MIEVSEGVLAFQKPGHLEIRLEIKMRIVIVVLVVDLILLLLEKLRFEVGIWFTFHPSNALETTGFG